MARTAQKGEIVKQINNLKITRIKLDKDTKAGEPYLYKVFDPNGNELYASIYLNDIEEKCQNYNAYTKKGQQITQTKNDNTAFHKEKKLLSADQLAIVKKAYEELKHSEGKIKIGEKRKEKYGISRSDTEILDIWLSVIIGKGFTEKQLKYCQLAQDFANREQQVKKSNKSETEQRKQYIVNKLLACEGILNALVTTKSFTNDFVQNENITRYLRSIDVDNADNTISERVKKQGILGLAKGISDTIDRCGARAAKYNLLDVPLSHPNYNSIDAMLHYEDALFNKVVELHKLTKDLIRKNNYKENSINRKAIYRELEEKERNYDLEGVEITEDDVDSVLQFMKQGMSKDNAIQKVLLCISETLESDTDYIYDDSDYTDIQKDIIQRASELPDKAKANHLVALISDPQITSDLMEAVVDAVEQGTTPQDIAKELQKRDMVLYEICETQELFDDFVSSIQPNKSKIVKSEIEDLFYDDFTTQEGLIKIVNRFNTLLKKHANKRVAEQLGISIDSIQPYMDVYATFRNRFGTSKIFYESSNAVMNAMLNYAHAAINDDIPVEMAMDIPILYQDKYNIANIMFNGNTYVLCVDGQEELVEESYIDFDKKLSQLGI